MRHWMVGCLFGAALVFAPPALAQTPPEAQGSEIVVTGSRDQERQLRDFVSALTQTPSGALLSRFETAVCPAVVGLGAAQKEAVAARMKLVAEAAGIAVGGAKCTPNVLLVVTSDKRAFLEALWKKHRDYFGQMPVQGMRRMARAPGPAAAWQIDGELLSDRGDPLPVNAEGSAVNETNYGGSRVMPGARPQFAAAAVVVEAEALSGLTTTQLADYAAMRAFTRSDPSKIKGKAPTILTVLEAPMGTEVPITLTEWDLAFLRSLYVAPPAISAGAQRTHIRRGVTKELQKAGTPD